MNIFFLVHVARLQPFSDTIYRGDSTSLVDVLRNPQQSVIRELVVKGCTFTPTTAYVEFSTATRKYHDVTLVGLVRMIRCLTLPTHFCIARTHAPVLSLYRST